MANKKKNIFGLLRVSIFLIVFLLFFQFFSMLFISKDGKHDYVLTDYVTKAYIGEKSGSLDVLLIGNSNLYRSFSPIDCWKDYGISSCVSGKPWQNSRGAYHILHDALRYQKPRVVILETDMIFSEKPMLIKSLKKITVKELKNFRTNYLSGKTNFINAFNTRKDVLLKAILKSSYSENIQTLDDELIAKIDYSFPLLTYRNRWDSLVLNDITDIDNVWHFANKGFVKSRIIDPYLLGFDYMNVNSKGPIEISKYQLKYLNNIIDLCKKNNIKLILTCVPTIISSNAKHSSIADFAEKNNLEFIDYNLLKTDTGFDWLTDSVDGGIHLNYSGALKITVDLSKYLKENYQLADHRADPEYAQWDEDIKIFSES